MDYSQHTDLNQDFRDWNELVFLLFSSFYPQMVSAKICTPCLDQVCTIPVVHADGGAPNLAYVAGGAKGISVIDIAQRKVVRTMTVAGNPDALLLSLDGRFLYVTQPQLGRVTTLAA